MPRTVFLFEYAVAGGAWDKWHCPELVQTLFEEGQAMAYTVAVDLLRCGWRVWMPIQQTSQFRWFLPNDHPPNVSSLVDDVSFEAGQEVRRSWFDAGCRHADVTWIIAPECRGILLGLVQRAESLGARLLGPSAEFINIAQDKHVTAEWLRKHGVPAPEGYPLEVWSQRGSQRDSGKWVIKPRLGAGSQDVAFWHPAPDSLCSPTFPLACDSSTQELPPQAWQVQPSLATLHGQGFDGVGENGWRVERFCEGRPVSIVAVVRGASVVFLPPCGQEPARDSPFEHVAWHLPVFWAHQQAMHLAQDALRALPVSQGYIGFDLIVDPNRQHGWVIEVNPRLTTSYLCLRQCYDGSLAGDIVNYCLGIGFLNKWMDKCARISRHSLREHVSKM